MAALLLLKLIFLFLTSIAKLASFMLSPCIAILAVLVIKLFRFPSLVIEAALQQVEDLIRAAVELAGYTIWSIISNMLDLFVCLASGYTSLAASVAAELVKRTRMMTRELADIVPELFEGSGEMVRKVVEDIWSNYKDAVGYVYDRANS